jgi:hypothetical protein
VNENSGMGGKYSNLVQTFLEQKVSSSRKLVFLCFCMLSIIESKAKYNGYTHTYQGQRKD